MLKGFNLTHETLNNPKESSLFHHRLVETFKHAFAHRSLLGDQENNTTVLKV